MTETQAARTEITPTEVERQLMRVLTNHRFASAERGSRFLQFAVERTLAERTDEVKEVVVATEVYGRSTAYDPKVDSIVRVEASRIRAKLQSYYEHEGAEDPIRITIPKGTYVPRFERRVDHEASCAAPEPQALPAARFPSTTLARLACTALFGVFLCGLVVLGRAALRDGSQRIGRTPAEAMTAWKEGTALLALDPHSGVTERGMPPILERAIECFELAVAKDPSFARGWASLSEAYAYASAYVGRDQAEDTRRAETAARRAISLDEQLAPGHAMLGAVLLYLRWDFKAAEARYRRAMELDPRGAYAIVEYADLLRETGRTEQAEAVIRKARALLPKLPVLAVKEAEIELDRNRPDAAFATASEAIRMKGNYARAHVALGMAWEAKDEIAQALAEYRVALAMNRWDRRALPAAGYLLGIAGRREEARGILQQLEQLNSRIRNCAYQVAVVHAGLGESEQALDWLERAHRSRQAHVPFMAVDYRLKALRAHPRFRALLDSLQLRAV